MSEHGIEVFFSEADGGFIADVPELEACSAFGRTRDEALIEMDRAKRAWIAAARAARKPIPPTGIAKR